MRPSDKKISVDLKALRRYYGIKQKEMARALGITRQYLYEMELNNEISEQHLEKLKECSEEMARDIVSGKFSVEKEEK